MVYEQQLSILKNVTIGTTSVLVSGIKDRKVIYIRNISTAGQVITIAFDNINVAVANRGIVLNAGETTIDSNSEGYKCWNGQISGVSSAAGGVISYMELPI